MVVMNTPNWQHHSKKDAKRKLKPQALRQAQARRGQLIKRLLNPANGRVSLYNRYIKQRDLCWLSTKSNHNLLNF